MVTDTENDEDRKKKLYSILILNKSKEFCCPYCCSKNHARVCERPLGSTPGTSVRSASYYIIKKVKIQKLKGKLLEQKLKQQFNEKALISPADLIFRSFGISELLNELKNASIPENKPSDLRTIHGIGYLGKLINPKEEAEKTKKRLENKNRVLGTSTLM